LFALLLSPKSTHMEESTSTSSKSHAVLHHLATEPHAYHPLPKAEVLQETQLQEEPFSSDIRAFCSLLARILMRCLKEQNEQALHIILLTSRTLDKELEYHMFM